MHLIHPNQNHPCSDRPITATGLIGSSLMGTAAAVVMGGSGMETILGSNAVASSSNQDSARRSSASGTNPSTPNTTTSGLSSIFNFKSVINAASKTATVAAPPAATTVSSTSNFFVTLPPPTVKPEPILIDTHSPPLHASAQSHKSIQGRISRFFFNLRGYLCWPAVVTVPGRNKSWNNHLCV